MNTTKLYTLGAHSCETSRPLTELRTAAARAGIQPTLELNGVAYFDDDALRRLDEVLVSPQHPEQRINLEQESIAARGEESPQT